MPVNVVVENVFGTMGTVFWCIQLIPQAWKSFRAKSTFGLSPFLMLIWASASLPLGVYNIAQNVNIPLIVQPQLFGLLAAICWVQCLYYESHLSLSRTLCVFFGFMIALAGLQVAFVYAVRHGLAENNDRPLQFFGVMTAILIFGGLIPQYYEIWKLKEVRGVSMIFMFFDLLGGLFSALSLVFKESIDPLLAFSYISVVILDGGVMLLQLILNPIARRRRVREGISAPAPPTVPQETTEKTPEPALKPQCGPCSEPQTPAKRSIEDGIPLEGVGDVLPPRSGATQEAEAAHAGVSG